MFQRCFLNIDVVEKPRVSRMMTKGLISLQVTGYMFRLDSIVVTIIAVLGAVSGKQSNKVLAFLP
ncbi:MAG: hypothetical protein ACKVHR_14765 [Pirellulales bacterium]